MDALFEKSRQLLAGWKGESYLFGRGILPEVGKLAARYGKRALVVGNMTYLKPVVDAVLASLKANGLELAGPSVAPDAAPNAPRDDVYRLEGWVLHHKPDLIVAVGGGSTIDACKAASVLAGLGARSCEIDFYFGTGQVSKALAETGGRIVPVLAVQVSASSGAHLTKYSNITNIAIGQKKLIVDEAIVPAACAFDYDVTASMPRAVTVDGALDAVAHCLEVFYGLPPEKWELGAAIAETGIELAVKYGPRVARDPRDMEAREAIGMATDLGGYAIMVGGTSGAHLTSFSLVDVAGHGTACGIMNPYYMVFFAPRIERQLRAVGAILARHGHIARELGPLSGRELGLAVAEGLVAFGKAVGAPTSLRELPGFTEAHIARAITAAKDPDLGMKLRNMPVPLTAELEDEFMEPILRAAVDGDFSKIRNMT